MLFEKHNILEWAKLNQEEFRRKYDDTNFRRLRDFLEQRIRNDSIRILRRLELTEQVFFQVRQKSATSLLNKMIKIAKSVTAGEEELLFRISKIPLDVSKDYFLYEIVKDIVGVRYICIDQPSLETLLDFLLRSETLYVKDFEIYRPFFSEYEIKKDRSDSLFSSLMHATPPIISKASNYESIHLELTFEAPLDLYPARLRDLDSPTSRGYSSSEPDDTQDLSLEIFDFRMKIQNRLLENLEAPFRKIISDFPIEAQIRTVTQHIWAQDEHRYIYSVIKEGAESRPDNILLEQSRGAFTALKYFLHSCDTIRHMIGDLHTKQTGKLNSLQGRGMGVITRLSFFGDDKFVDVKRQLIELDGLTADYTRKLRENGHVNSNFWSSAVETLHKIIREASINEESYFSGRHEGNLPYWGRQRIVAMILGFILLYCVEEPDENKLDFRKDVRGHLRDVKFLGALIADDQYLVFPRYIANLAARVYEFIRLNDRYFLEYASQVEQKAEQIFDPLIFARHASALYRLGEFSAAYRVLGEFFESSHLKKLDWKAHEGYSKVELYCRQLQYYWYRCALDYDQLVSDLSIYDKLIRSVHTTSTQLDGRDSVKAICWTVWIYGVLLVLRIPVTGDLKKTLNQMTEQVSRLVAAGDIPDELKNKVYFHAACAVSEFHSGNFTGAKKALEKASLAISSGVPHPPAAVAIQESMLEILYSEIHGSRFEWDLFISYSNDDLDLVKKIVSMFNEERIRVFVDFEYIRAGDPITPTIEKGLRGSRHVLMVVTDTYLNKKWTELERIWFETQEEWVGERKIFVILNGVSRRVFQVRYPTLADRRVLEIGEDGIHDIQSAILEIVRSLSLDTTPSDTPSPQRDSARGRRPSPRAP